MGHTPGPWNVRDKGKSFPFIETDDENQLTIAHILSSLDQQADANLIAAAPEMLEALEAVVDAMQLNKVIIP